MVLQIATVKHHFCFIQVRSYNIGTLKIVSSMVKMVEAKFYRINLGNKEYTCYSGFSSRIPKNTLLSSAKKLVTTHFLSVYVTSSQDEHLSSLESITFIMLFSFLTEHIKSTKST